MISIGVIATTASLVLLLGFVSQIMKNYRRKSCEGLSTNLIYSACIAYTLWGVYGITKPDIYLILSQIPGAILSFILLFQLFYYKKKRIKGFKERNVSSKKY